MVDVSGGNVLYYYHYDGQGSVVALSKYVSGSVSIVETYEYDAFGNTTIKNASSQVIDESAYDNPYMYTARRFDPEAGLYYYRARMYSPSIGRFLQPDPIGYGDGMNMYAYVGNNPTGFIDPFGLESKEGGSFYGVDLETYVDAWFEVGTLTAMWATGTGPEKVHIGGQFAFSEMMKHHPDVEAARMSGRQYSHFSPTPEGLRNMFFDWYHPRHLLGSVDIKVTSTEDGGQRIHISNPHTLESCLRIFKYTSYFDPELGGLRGKAFRWLIDSEKLRYKRSVVPFGIGGRVDQDFVWDEEE